MPILSRRRLLSTAAGVAGAALTSSLLPPSVRKAVEAGPPARSSLRDLKHVVCLMQENRSFDHYFGTLAGVRGFGGRRVGATVVVKHDDDGSTRGSTQVVERFPAHATGQRPSPMMATTRRSVMPCSAKA